MNYFEALNRKREFAKQTYIHREIRIPYVLVVAPEEGEAQLEYMIRFHANPNADPREVPNNNGNFVVVGFPVTAQGMAYPDATCGVW